MNPELRRGRSGFWQNFSNRLANQLIITFILTVSVLIAALTFVSYTRTNNILINDFITANQSILKLANTNFENYVAQIDELSVTFRKDTEFMRYLTTDPTTFTAQTYIQNQIKNLFYIRNDIEKLEFYIPDYRLLYTISRRNDKLWIARNKNLTAEDWYQKTVKGEYFRYIVPLAGRDEVTPDGGNSFFLFRRALVSIPGWRPLGIVAISFNRSVLDKMMLDTLNQRSENICIYDQKNQPFYVSEAGLRKVAAVNRLLEPAARQTAGGNFRIQIHNQPFLVVFHRSRYREWAIAKLIPLSLIQSKVRQTRNISLWIGGLFILIFIGLIVTVANTITGPLRRLTRQMDKVGGGNFTVKFEARGSYEIIRLADRFNWMVDRINQLINEKYLAQLNEKTARLKALEAQINPHFLYNSLQAIATKAVIGGQKEISRMVEALAYILRYCIKGGDQVRIAAEIEHVRKYLLLQTVRYEDRLTVDIRVEEALSEVLVPKLSIQTLVENAVQHALENMTRAITIRIRTFAAADRILIVVTDDGPGMTAAHLAAVTREMAEGAWSDASGRPAEESIGLKNLYSRLKLMYGEEARLELESVWGAGTTARIVLPRQVD